MKTQYIVKIIFLSLTFFFVMDKVRACEQNEGDACERRVSLFTQESDDGSAFFLIKQAALQGRPVDRDLVQARIYASVNLSPEGFPLSAPCAFASGQDDPFSPAGPVWASTFPDYEWNRGEGALSIKMGHHEMTLRFMDMRTPEKREAFCKGLREEGVEKMKELFMTALASSFEPAISQGYYLEILARTDALDIRELKEALRSRSVSYGVCDGLTAHHRSIHNTQGSLTIAPGIITQSLRPSGTMCVENLFSQYRATGNLGYRAEFMYTVDPYSLESFKFYLNTIFIFHSLCRLLQGKAFIPTQEPQ
jgi:hypothetical protein